MNHLQKQLRRQLQKYGFTILALLSISIFLVGCSAENFNRAGYESVKNRQCNEDLGNLNCRDDYPTYEEYQREKSRIHK